MRNRGVECWHIEDLDSSRLSFALRDKHSDRQVLARRSDGKIGDTFSAQLLPDGAHVVRLVELDLVGNTPGTVFFICSVLQVPSSRVLLHVSSNWHAFAIFANVFIYGLPNLEVLGRISVLVLGRSLPGYDVGSER